MNDAERKAYDNYLDTIRTQDSVLDTYRTEGLLEGRMIGREEGRAEGREEGARNQSIAIAKEMIKMNLDKSIIKRATGLTDEELDNLT